jgi:HNH endonuclease
MDRKMVDDRAVHLAKDIKRYETELIETLQWVDHYKIYEDFELTSLFKYCTKRLGLSDDRAYTYMKVARKAVEVPILKKALEEDKLSLTNAKHLAKVITPENQVSWMEMGTTLSTRDLEKEIAKANPQEKVKEKVKPLSETLYELRCTLSPRGVKLLERTMDLIKKQNRGEVIEKILEEFVEKHDPLKIAERAEKRKTQAPAARQAYKNGRRTPTPRPIAHAVIKKAQAQCTHYDSQGNRCPNRRFLHLHHIEPVSRGGQHDLNNISVLCSSHHRMHHSPKTS